MKPLLKKLPYKDIKICGWLEKQLQIQAEGLSGNIERFFADVSLNSAWLGGDGEAWERGPYYLDGLVPLAFLLNDKPLLKKVFHWVDKILESKNDAVGFGPLRNNDYWPRMVVQKALISFYRATSDKRIIPFLRDYYRFMLDEIDKHPLFFWAAARGLEGGEAMFEVYEQTGEKFILELMDKLYKYSYDWADYFSDFKYVLPTSKYLSRPLVKAGKAILEPFDELAKKSQKIPPKKSKEKIQKFNNKPLVKKLMFTHGVNVAMAYKYPLYYGVLKENKELINLFPQGYKTIMKHHGLSIGAHTTDEHLMGSDAAGGVELCAVMEQAYSFEEGLRLTQDNFYADILEYTVFNSMPATFTEDMKAHQYTQQPNQIAADKKPRQFFDTNNEANIFGIAPNYGCCAANMHQGFPKFAENLCYTDNEKLYFLVYAPCEISTEIGGKKISLKQTMEYPFENAIRFEVETANNSKVVFRIPKFVEKVYHNKDIIDITQKDKIEISLNGGDVVHMELQEEIKPFENSDKSISYRLNNILLTMPLSFKERYVRGQRPYHYREFVSQDEYNFSPIIKNGKPIVVDKKTRKVSKIPFSREAFPFEYTVKARQVINWKKKKNSLQSPPEKPILGEEKQIKLIPYGCSYLRVTQFAKINEKEV